MDWVLQVNKVLGYHSDDGSLKDILNIIDVYKRQNFFVLGPSGSGKSFYVNSKVRQWVLDNTDIVLVDTGHSLSLIHIFIGFFIPLYISQGFPNSSHITKCIIFPSSNGGFDLFANSTTNVY